MIGVGVLGWEARFDLRLFIRLVHLKVYVLLASLMRITLKLYLLYPMSIPTYLM
jgi:hypothetical protein